MSFSRRRVVITGLGVVSPYVEKGDDLQSFTESVFSGKSAVRNVEGLVNVSDLPTKFGAMVEENPEWVSMIERKMYRKYDRSTKFAIVAAKKALAHSQLDPSSVDPLRAGVLIATGLGGMQSFYDGVLKLESKGAHFVNPYFISLVLTNTPGDAIALDWGWNGVNYSVSTACASANYMMWQALRHIQCGEADVIAVGGTEAALNRVAFVGFSACRALSTYAGNPEEASRPFDLARDGFVLGEGAGVLIFEELEHAKARGAHILAEVKGAATTTDAYHLTNPREDGKMVAACMGLALKDADLLPEKIDLIKAHATSTHLGDLAEVRAMRDLFGDHLTDGSIAVTAPKSLFGHALGAAAAIEAIVVTEALNRGEVPPTRNLVSKDPGVEGLLIPEKALKKKLTHAMLNSFGFGGHNCSLIFSRL